MTDAQIQAVGRIQAAGRDVDGRHLMRTLVLPGLAWVPRGSSAVRADAEHTDMTSRAARQADKCFSLREVAVPSVRTSESPALGPCPDLPTEIPEGPEHLNAARKCRWPGNEVVTHRGSRARGKNTQVGTAGTRTGGDDSPIPSRDVSTEDIVRAGDEEPEAAVAICDVAVQDVASPIANPEAEGAAVRDQIVENKIVGARQVDA